MSRIAIKSKENLAFFAITFPSCMACGHTGDGFLRRLTIHHCVRLGRSDDLCNLLRLCQRCHDRVHGGTKDWLTLPIQLSLKKLRDPAHWNPARLRELFLKNLPDLQPVPSEYLVEFEKWRPMHPAKEVEVPW